MQEFHRQLFTNSADSLRQEIKRITGVEVREATAEIETTTGTVVQVFTTGTMVQVFLLARGVSAETWNGSGSSISMKMEVLPCWSCQGKDESVVVGGADGFERLLKVTVLEINGGKVRLGFEVDVSSGSSPGGVGTNPRHQGSRTVPLQDPSAPVV